VTDIKTDILMLCYGTYYVRTPDNHGNHPESRPTVTCMLRRKKKLIRQKSQN